MKELFDFHAKNLRIYVSEADRETAVFQGLNTSAAFLTLRGLLKNAYYNSKSTKDGMAFKLSVFCLNFFQIKGE